jgi:DNA recombination protein RmuC
MNTPFLVLLAAVAIVAVLQIIILMRSRQTDVAPQLAQLQNELQGHQRAANERSERSERELRDQVQSSAQATRQELGANFTQFQQGLTTQLTAVATLQNNQMHSSWNRCVRRSPRRRRPVVKSRPAH